MDRKQTRKLLKKASEAKTVDEAMAAAASALEQNSEDMSALAEEWRKAILQEKADWVTARKKRGKNLKKQ
jgi:chromosome segregation and condensation protein ScpB